MATSAVSTGVVSVELLRHSNTKAPRIAGHAGPQRCAGEERDERRPEIGERRERRDEIDRSKGDQGEERGGAERRGGQDQTVPVVS